MKKAIVICFCCLSLTADAQSLMTVGEIYDYNIGDVFIKQVGGFSTPPTYGWDTIINKYYSPSLDTVFYVRNSYSYTSPACQTCTSSTSVSLGNLFCYTNLNDTIGTGLGTKPADINCIDSTGYTGTWFDTLYYNPDYCNTLTTKICSMANGPIGPDTCMFFFEPYYGFTKYAKGLGFIQYYWNTCSNGFPNCQSGFHLLYYKKGTDSCGYALAFPTGLNENSNINEFIIFPNPSTAEVTVTFSKTTRCNIQLTNTLGEMLEQTQIYSSWHTLDMSSSPKGIYFVTITDEEGNKTVKKIVKM
jgi:hypothetical protein